MVGEGVAVQQPHDGSHGAAACGGAENRIPAPRNQGVGFIVRRVQEHRGGVLFLEAGDFDEVVGGLLL